MEERLGERLGEGEEAKGPAEEKPVKDTKQPLSQKSQAQKVSDTIAKLNEMGIDPNSFVTLFIPVLEHQSREATAAIRNEMQSMIQQQSKLIGEQIVAEVTSKAASMNTAPPPDGSMGADIVTTQQPAPSSGQRPPGGGGFGGASQSTIDLLVAKILGGSQQGDLGGSLKQMADTAKVFGAFYSDMMQPLIDIQAKMRQNVLAEMTTYSKTGGELPWEREVTPTVTPAVPPPARANLNQEERDKAITELAKRIRLTG